MMTAFDPSRLLSYTLGFLLLAAPFVALAESPKISLIEPPNGGVRQVVVVGEWASGCPPLLQDVRVVDRELTLVAQPDSKTCAAEPGAYSFQAELPADAKSSASNGVWRVRYELRDDPLSAPRLMAFELIDLNLKDANQPPAQRSRSVEPEPGFWWGEVGGEFDHAGPGLGAQLEKQSDTLALTFSGYAENGKPEWLFGATPMKGAVSDIALTRLDGGRGPFAGYRGPSEAADGGRVQIEWITSARAVFWFSRAAVNGKGIELQPISMVRFDFGQDPGAGWVGRWWLDASDGQSSLALELLEFVPRDDGFTLLGKNGEALQCDDDAKRPQSPPTSCELQLSDGKVWRFEDVGLSRLHGVDEKGRSVKASLIGR